MNFFHQSFPPEARRPAHSSQTTIVASAGNASATFTLTQGLQANAAITGGVQRPADRGSRHVRTARICFPARS